MQRTIATGRASYTAERHEWAQMLRELADAYPAALHPLRDVKWSCKGDLLTVTIRWRWWEQLGMTAHVTHSRVKNGKRHISTNYPVGIPAILREGAAAVTEQMPERIELAQHRDTAWWVLTLDDNSGTVPTESIE